MRDSEGLPGSESNPRPLLPQEDCRRSSFDGREKPLETILLVEDDVALREVASKILERSGYIVLTAENGEQAVRAFEQNDGTVDLLVTDLMMAGTNGAELARTLAQRQPSLKTIFISGCDTPSIKDEIDNHWFSFLRKPFTREALSRKVREVIDGTTYPADQARIN